MAAAASRRIYFAGSIRGGREDANLYMSIINHLAQRHGTVLTEHVGLASLTSSGESQHKERAIHDRDMEWLRSAEVIVAEVTTPSLGVGYELGWACALQKHVLCLFRPSSGRSLSAMVRGAPDNGGRFVVRDYEGFEQAASAIDAYFASLQAS